MNDAQKDEFFARDGKDGEDVKTVNDIGPKTEGIADAYASSLSKCTNWEEAEKVVDRWAFLVQDAKESLNKCKPKYDWAKLNKDVRDDSSGHLDEIVDDAGALFMPEILLRCCDLSYSYGAPWGTAFVQGVMAGALDVVDGVVYVKKVKSKLK